ncbi:hypothetical protein GCM10010433_54440 [Streptomyces pulveraceus]
MYGLGALVAARHGPPAPPLSLTAALPGTAGIRLSAPRLVHRTEVLHPRAPAAAARELVTRLTSLRFPEVGGAGARTLVRRCGR